MRQTNLRSGYQKGFHIFEQPHFTKHARKRMAQRNISSVDVRLTMYYGQKLHRTGIVFFFLGQKNIPDVMHTVLDHLEGTTVLFDPGTAEVITVYRNRNGLRDIKRKAKHILPKQYLQHA